MLLSLNHLKITNSRVCVFCQYLPSEQLAYLICIHVIIVTLLYLQLYDLKCMVSMRYLIFIHLKLALGSPYLQISHSSNFNRQQSPFIVEI